MIAARVKEGRNGGKRPLASYCELLDAAADAAADEELVLQAAAHSWDAAAPKRKAKLGPTSKEHAAAAAAVEKAARELAAADTAMLATEVRKDPKYGVEGRGRERLHGL